MVTNVGYGNRLRQNLIVELNHSYSRLNTGAKAEHGFKGLWNYLSFDHFRKQFRAFLSFHRLPTTICGNVLWQWLLRKRPSL